MVFDWKIFDEHVQFLVKLHYSEFRKTSNSFSMNGESNFHLFLKNGNPKGNEIAIEGIGKQKTKTICNEHC